MNLITIVSEVLCWVGAYLYFMREIYFEIMEIASTAASLI